MAHLEPSDRTILHNLEKLLKEYSGMEIAFSQVAQAGAYTVHGDKDPNDPGIIVPYSTTFPKRIIPVGM